MRTTEADSEILQFTRLRLLRALKGVKGFEGGLQESFGGGSPKSFGGKPPEISVARDFSRTPGGRLRAQGPYSGEAFRDDLLLPRMRASSQGLVVNLDGVMGYSMGFLEEAFGGAARVLGRTPVETSLSFVYTDDPSVLEEVWGFIRDA